MRLASDHDFEEDLKMTVRELLTRGKTRRGIRTLVTRALGEGPFEDAPYALERAENSSL